MIIPYEIIYFCIGFIAAFALSGILLLVVMKRLKNKFTTSSVFDLNQIKDLIGLSNKAIENATENTNSEIITKELSNKLSNNPLLQSNKPKYKFISKDIEVIDIEEDVPKQSDK